MGIRKASLELIILLPVVFVLVFAGVGGYWLIVHSVQEFADRTVEDSFESVADGVFRIADRQVDELNKAGLAEDSKATKLRKLSALLEIEDFARKNEVAVIIREADNEGIVLFTGIPKEYAQISAGGSDNPELQKQLPDGRNFYLHRSAFSPWEWRILLLKDASHYASLLADTRYILGASGGALLLMALFLIVYLKRAVSKPIHAIVNRFSTGQLPQYKGIHEFEFLSDSIAQMMTELSENREELETGRLKLEAYSQTLEREVEERTRDLARSVEELQALREVGHAVNSTLDVEEVLATIVGRACELSDADGGIIFEFDESKGQFHAKATHGIPSDRLDDISAMPIVEGEGVVGSAAAKGMPIQVGEIRSERTLMAPRIRRELVDLGAQSMVAVPLIREAQILGCLLIWRSSLGSFSDETVTLLQALALQSGLAIHNARQAAELAELNEGLERKVSEQLAELQRLSQLKRFFSPQLADLIVSSGDEEFMESHRQEITVVFCDLRNFTEFSATAEPEEQFRLLREYHNTVGSLIFRFGATLEHLAGDGVMAFFNDPMPCPEPARQAIEMALAMRDEVSRLTDEWSKRGFDLGFGVGIEVGYATLGQVGFEGQFHYMAIGSVANLAARLCDTAEAGQVLITQRVYSEVENMVDVEPLGAVDFKGFHKPIPVFNVVKLRLGGT